MQEEEDSPSNTPGIWCVYIDELLWSLLSYLAFYPASIFPHNYTMQVFVFVLIIPLFLHQAVARFL